VRGTRVWGRLLGLKAVVVKDVYCGDQGEVVVAVRPNWRERDRCGVCRRRCPGFDLGEGRRRWRALDLATTFAFVEAEAPRVRCARHGVVVCAVPWARHGSRFTRSFEDQVAWLARTKSRSTGSSSAATKKASRAGERTARRCSSAPRSKSAAVARGACVSRCCPTRRPRPSRRSPSPRPRPEQSCTPTDCSPTPACLGSAMTTVRARSRASARANS
jgi:transposase